MAETSMNVPLTQTSAPTACVRTCVGATAASATWAMSQIPRARTVWMLMNVLSIVCCVTTDCAATHLAATPAPAQRALSSGLRQTPVKISMSAPLTLA